MDWYVYMLLCDQKMFYVGITNDLVNRFTAHKLKQSFYTIQFSDLKIVYVEKYSNKYKAAEREKQLKGWSKAKKLLLIQGRLGKNNCTEVVEVLLRQNKNLVSLLRA
jgi:predicted GIY-YIG superfamily endonuclease